MAVMDEFKEERQRVKNGTKKEKMAYFWEYYKWYVIIPAVIIIAIGSYIYHVVTTPDTVLSGVVMNAHTTTRAETVTEIENEFCELAEIDQKEYCIELNTSITYVAGDTTGAANYEASQALMAWVAAGATDFITGDVDSMVELAHKQYFCDLREILSEEEIAFYEPYFLYIDNATLTKKEELYENMDYETEVLIPDCTKPETMEEPIPVMIDISKCEKMQELYGDTEGILALGATVKTERQDMLLTFLEYLMN